MADKPFWSPSAQDPALVPFRRAFDAARDPLTARNALGIPEPTAAPDLTIYALKSDFPAGAWTAWTPTITSDVGTITSTSITTARYTTAGKTVTAYFDISITNKGTGSGLLKVTLPVTMNASGGGSAVGVEIALTGSAVVGRLQAATSATTAFLQAYNGTTVVVTGARIIGTLIYENA